MSGEKRTPIQIVRDDLRSMRNNVYNLEKHRQRLENDLRQARNENRQQIHQLSYQMEERDRRNQEAINGLESDMKEMAQEHHRAMQKQRREFIRAQEKQRNELMTEIAASEQRSAKRIEHLRDWTQERLQSQRKEYLEIARKQQEQINHLKKDIQAINQREDNRQARAGAYIADLHKLVNAKDRDLFEKFAPGKLEKIERQLTLAEKQLADDVPSAAIGTVQAAHFELMDLEQEVLEKEAEFEMCYGVALDAVSGLLTNIRENRNIRLEEDAAEQEADYWTNGQYSALEKKVGELKDQLENDKAGLSIEQVNEILDQLDDHAKKQEEILKEAVEKIISSQLRAEMGDVVVDAMQQRGFRMIDGESGYADDDQRQPYLVKLHNRAGTQIVTVISPDKENHQNIISVNTFDGGFHNEEAEQVRNQEIRKALSDQGLQLGDTQCNDLHISEFYDVKNIVQKGKGLSKSVLKKAGMLQEDAEKSL